MVREERVKWEEERREKDSEIRDLRVKQQDASVRASKKGPASPGPGEGGKDVEDQRNFLQLAAMEIRDGLVQATISIEDPRDSLQDARGKETTQGQKTLTALTALRDKYNAESTARQAGGAARRWQWWWELTPRVCCSPLLSHMFLLEGLDGGAWQSKDRWGVRLRSAMFGVVQRGPFGYAFVWMVHNYTSGTSSPLCLECLDRATRLVAGAFCTALKNVLCYDRSQGLAKWMSRCKRP